MSQPVIILGAARSGTKYLRDILAQAPNAARVPYDIGYIWRYGSEDHPDDVLPPALLTEKKKRFIRAQVHRLAKATPGGGTVVLEKTVGNTLRVPFVDGVFPEAKYVHLVRDGRAVTESAARQWSEPLNYGRLFEKLKGLPLQNVGYVFWFAGNLLKGMVSGRGGGNVWGPRYPGIEADVEADRDLVEICAEQWRASVEHALAGLEAIPAKRQITIRYDELVSGTDALERVAQFCGLKQVEDVLAAHRERVDTRADTKWQRELDEEEQAAMLAIIEPMLRRLGYLGERAA